MPPGVPSLPPCSSSRRALSRPSSVRSPVEIGTPPRLETRCPPPRPSRRCPTTACAAGGKPLNELAAASEKRGAAAAGRLGRLEVSPERTRWQRTGATSPAAAAPTPGEETRGGEEPRRASVSSGSTRSAGSICESARGRCDCCCRRGGDPSPPPLREGGTASFEYMICAAAARSSHAVGRTPPGETGAPETASSKPRCTSEQNWRNVMRPRLGCSPPPRRSSPSLSPVGRGSAAGTAGLLRPRDGKTRPAAREAGRGTGRCCGAMPSRRRARYESAAGMVPVQPGSIASK
mmetsp:Transcript_22740/g.66918  ORF Transcript_22740/g.66918 Transcript_22740/m.66918 type:complete len:291 (+) Transcript_22740:330-1202(+)